MNVHATQWRHFSESLGVTEYVTYWSCSSNIASKVRLTGKN